MPHDLLTSGSRRKKPVSLKLRSGLGDRSKKIGHAYITCKLLSTLILYRLIDVLNLALGSAGVKSVEEVRAGRGISIGLDCSVRVRLE